MSLRGFNAKKSDADLGLGWWELPEFENYQVGVADATAAMIHAIQLPGWSVQARAIKRYTAEEKKEKILCHQLLRTAFDEAEESRANFEEQARRTKSFDLHMDNCKQVSEGWLALQNVHSYKAMSRLYPRLAALERELEETIQSMTDLTNPGGAPEVDIIEEETWETVRKRREMEKQRSSRMDASPASLRPQINFEDKDRCDVALQLSDRSKKTMWLGSRAGLHHLYQLLMQGQQKLQQNVEGLENMEKESQRLAEIVSTKLRNKYERWALEIPKALAPSPIKRMYWSTR
eukprot:g6707.t1